MNLKTHTAYPEIQIAEDHSFIVKIINARGKELFTSPGQGSDNQDARVKAKALIAAQADKYIIKEEGE